MTKGSSKKYPPEVRLSISNYSSARALKDDIRRQILDRKSSDWHLCGIDSRGSTISLKFRN